MKAARLRIGCSATLFYPDHIEGRRVVWCFDVISIRTWKGTVGCVNELILLCAFIALNFWGLPSSISDFGIHSPPKKVMRLYY